MLIYQSKIRYLVQMASTERTYRLPKQERSRQRYNQMLNTAARLFAEQGIDQVTTNHIAAEATVSIGSLYQYFPNKEAIIKALIDRYMESVRNVFPQKIDTEIPIETVIREVISGFVRFSRQNSGFQVILVGLEGTSNAGAAAEMQAAIVAGIDRVLAAYYPDLSPDRRRLCAIISLSLVAGIMSHDLPEEMMIDQMVLATTAYQQAFLNR